MGSGREAESDSPKTQLRLFMRNSPLCRSHSFPSLSTHFPVVVALILFFNLSFIFGLMAYPSLSLSLCLSRAPTPSLSRPFGFSLLWGVSFDSMHNAAIGQNFLDFLLKLI